MILVDRIYGILVLLVPLVQLGCAKSCGLGSSFDGEDCLESGNATDRAAAQPLPRQIRPLGRPVTLGAMYDARTDMFFEDTSFWSPETIKMKQIYDDQQQEVKSDVNLMKTIKNRLDYLKVNAELKLSFMGGLIKVSGSAGFLSDKVSNRNEVNVNLNYHTKKYKAYIPPSTPLNNIKYCENKLFTHAVTSITYGMDATFVFKKLVTEKHEIQEIEGKLKVMIKSIPGITIEGSASVNLNKEQKDTISATSLKMYGDFSPTEPLPTNFQEAVKFYKKLPTLTGTRANKYQGAAPLLVKITPVNMICTGSDRILNSISSGAIDGVVNMIDELQDLDMQVGELLARKPAIMFAPIRNNLNAYRTALYEYTSNVKAKLKDLLPKIRGGDGKKEIDLLNLTRDWKLSQFVSSKSGRFLTERQREIESVEKLLKMYPSSGFSNIAVVDFASAIDNHFILNRNTVVVGEIKVLSLPSVTTSFLAGKAVNGKHWYNNLSTVGRIGYKIRQLRDFALANKEMSDRGYLIKLLPVEDTTTLKVKAFNLGEKVSDDYIVQNQAPQVTKGAIGSTFFELVINRPSLSSVTGCKFVFTKVGGKSKTRQLDFTKPNKETFKIDGLSPLSTYEITAVYVTDMGVSPPTVFTVKGANATTTAPTSPPQNVIIQRRRFNSLSFKWEAPMTIAQGIKKEDVSYKISVRGLAGYRSDHRTTKLEQTVSSLQDASLYDITVSAFIIHNGTEYTSGTVTVKLNTAPLPLVIARDTSVPVTKNSIGVKWTKPSRMPTGATINSFTVVYKIKNSNLTPSKLSVHGGSTRAKIQDLTMGQTYDFKVKMNMGKFGDSEYSSGLVVRTLESTTDLEKLEKALENKLNTAKNTMATRINNLKNTMATRINNLKSGLENRIAYNKRDIDATKNTMATRINNLKSGLENRIASNKREIDATKMRGKKSSICGYKLYWSSAGTIRYYTVHKEIDEVNSSLNSYTGIYTAGISGVYEISVSGIPNVYPGGLLAISIEGIKGSEDYDFILSSISSGGPIYDTAAQTRHVTLTAGQKISLNYKRQGNAIMYRIKFCVTYY